MFGGSSSGGRGRDTRNHRLHHLSGGSTYNPNQQQQQNTNMNMNMLHPQQQQPHPMSPYHQQLLSPTATSLSSGAYGGGGGGGDDEDEFPKRDERVVQWGNQETRDLIAVRGELEAEFSVAKRKKGLWEVVVAKMKQLGYSRTPEQCKCKWKNLLVRYKGKEASDPDNSQQFPFYEEMQEIFMRSYHMPQLVHEPETSSLQSGKKRVRKADADESFEQFITDSHGDYHTSDEDKVFPQKMKIPEGKRVRKVPLSSRSPKEADVSNNGSSLTAIQEILQNFFRQQERIDVQWRETMEKSAHERDRFEFEWRQMKEKMERERLMQEEEWREREEQRKAREETRAEKREALLTILLKKLVQEYEN